VRHDLVKGLFAKNVRSEELENQIGKVMKEALAQ